MSLIPPNDVWLLLGCIAAGAAVSIWLEQTNRWAAKLSGPVVALLFGMALSNTRLLPTEASSYGMVEDYLVPIAIPLLIFRANILRILRETGPMFLCFHIASVGTVLGAFLAAFLFRGAFERVPEVTGIMTGSYIGGGVNFVAIQRTYDVAPQLASSLMVADNFIMAGMFAALLVIAGSRFFRRQFPHPHSLAGDREDVTALAAQYWRRKEISLLDIAWALAIAVAVAAVSSELTELLKRHITSPIGRSIIANPFVLITILSVGITTAFHRFTEKIQGAEEFGMYLLYLFFVVIGLRADLVQVVKHVPVLFLFCLVMALTNLGFTLAAGKLLKQNLEELLLSVNATLGGAPTAAAMAISRGWSKLVVPGLLAGIWGYIIGTFVGILVAEALLKLFGIRA
ncbi:MAG TPA: DUF819 family protein [Verrucomicrobiae bacterium]|nr:DUF819 family protein [Verrucomicrobiae bacterium]